jgi:hypothetical protein
MDREIESAEPASVSSNRKDHVDDSPIGIIHVAAEYPRRVIDHRTTDLKVQLGPEATRVDIRL